ncbi:30S ribosomal protein S11 [Octopus bimaculoides]|uniref:Ribosomal protein S11 n=1 Tax=Octopus bimaculoides TaxID=37653 RepID=A0A0L8GMQ1_OCTBM|nr:30S ribosomal protein S11 [Octopus bimaculoides]XP_014779865.1 30S ribosomal protein S11 [Octopus bimaculoides]XP_014779866.1 30S ribosomal protein S11 [Octopus bimaculoides]|eukprot:XP_014779864.1 PREDICTED: 30S ribosomal protein S11-like [Octopus bimaculoides]
MLSSVLRNLGQSCVSSPLKNKVLSVSGNPLLLTQAIHISFPRTVLDKDNRLKKWTQMEAKERLYLSDTAEVDANPDIFPTLRTPDMLVDGVPYKHLHIAHIKATRNNTIITISEHNGSVLILKSCGTEGFQNARKGTNIAGQATGVAAGEKAITAGVKNIRVAVQGIGPGRFPAIKGLQLAGLNIVSLTDTTPVTYCNERPRKQRRL